MGSEDQKQVNLYWDTPDRQLRRARVALRVRVVGRRAQMTFKKEQRYQAGISHRTEVTVAVPASEFKKNSFLPSRLFHQVLGRMRSGLGSGPLEKVLELRTHRRIRRFAWGRFRVELALDRVGVFRAGRKVGSFCEIELENLNAREDLFQAVVQNFRRRLGKEIRLSRIPKVERGLRLLQRGSKQPA